MSERPDSGASMESAVSGQTILVIFAAMLIGVVFSLVVLPTWLPRLAGSLTGPQPKVFWYLSRATAFVAMGLLWASMMLGLGISNKLARLWPGAPAAFAIHEYVSLLGLAFAGFHGLILLGDQYSKFTLAQLLSPFATASYRPFWVGLGQLGLYVWAIVTASFYVRKHIGQRTWRLLHFASFLSYAGALVHGLASGTDTGQTWALLFYLVTSGSFVFLFIYRVLASLADMIEKALETPTPVPAPVRDRGNGT